MDRSRGRIFLALGVVALLALITMGCGSGGTRSAGRGASPDQVVEVTVLDNSFTPTSLVITPGTTVRWVNKGLQDHNTLVVSGNDDFGVEAKSFGPGKTHEHRFTKIGEYSYYCSLHGTAQRGMVGKIIVTDDPDSVDTSVTTAPPDTRVGGGGGDVLRVPGRYPTIQAAVNAAKPHDMVLVGKGKYREAVKVTTDNIVIRGEDRNETVLDGGFELDNGILVSGAGGVAVENMTAMNYKVNGFFWTGVQGYRGSYLTASRNGDYGIYAFDSRYGQFDHSYGSGNADAGFYIGQCTPCDALITDSFSELNGLGYSGTNAGGNLRIVNSTFRYNRAGIVPNSGAYEKYPPEKQTTIVGNTVYGNSRDDVPAINAALLIQGSGIVSAGGIDNIIERNLVYDHAKGGILLLGFPEGETVWDVTGNKVRDNVVSDSKIADLAMVTKDANVGNCFEGNTFATSAPANIETVAPCTGASSGDRNVGAKGLADFVTNQNSPSADYKKMPLPSAQPSMPDPVASPFVPAGPGNLPTIQIDVATITVPSRPA